MAPGMTCGDHLDSVAELRGSQRGGEWHSLLRYSPFCLFFLILPAIRRGQTHAARAKHAAKLAKEKGRTIPTTNWILEIRLERKRRNVIS